MTTEILSSEPQVPHHSQTLSPATQTKLAGVVGKITGILSPEGKEEIKEKNERMQQLLIQLQEEIQVRIKEIGYDYESDNYERRLCQSDEFMEEVFVQNILSHRTNNNIFLKFLKKIVKSEKYIKKS